MRKIPCPVSHRSENHHPLPPISGTGEQYLALQFDGGPKERNVFVNPIGRDFFILCSHGDLGLEIIYCDENIPIQLNGHLKSKQFLFPWIRNCRVIISNNGHILIVSQKPSNQSPFSSGTLPPVEISWDKASKNDQWVSIYSQCKIRKGSFL